MATTLDELLKKKAGLKVARKESITIKLEDMEFELSPLSDDEQLEVLFAYESHQGLDLYKEEVDICKRIMYKHCKTLQEVAKAEPPKGEPWDVFEELFTVSERGQLASQIIARVVNDTTEDTSKNA